MKRFAAGLAACLVLLLMAVPVYAQGGISGSAHDFRGEAWNTSGTGTVTDQICIVCHTPHNAKTVTGSVLWNHTVTTVSSYTVYTSATMDATPTGQPDGQSKLCLSCHDGTVALDDFGTAPTQTTYVGDVNANAEVGVDLSNDHPISISMVDAQSTDTELHDPTGAPAELLFSGNVECASCHDVHNNGDGTEYLLRKDNAGSALCFICHNK